MEIDFYTSKRGKSDVKEFLLTLPGNSRRKVQSSLDRLEKYGISKLLKTNLIKSLKGHKNLYEIKAKSIRIFFTMINKTAYLLHCFKKQSNNTPKKEIKKASQRKKELIRRFIK